MDWRAKWEEESVSLSLSSQKFELKVSGEETVMIRCLWCQRWWWCQMESNRYLIDQPWTWKIFSSDSSKIFEVIIPFEWRRKVKDRFFFSFLLSYVLYQWAIITNWSFWWCDLLHNFPYTHSSCCLLSLTFLTFFKKNSSLKERTRKGEKKLVLSLSQVLVWLWKGRMEEKNAYIFWI